MKLGILKNVFSNMRPSMLWLERQVLLFPVIVVFLACCTFLLGGHYAAWQWWTALEGGSYVAVDGQGGGAAEGGCGR